MAQPVADLSFAKRRDPQSASTLMTLPAELRLKILRMLLKKGDVLASFRQYLGADEQPYTEEHQQRYSKNVLSLSAQIVVCCQMLHEESLAILYKENTVSIEDRDCLRMVAGYASYSCIAPDIAFNPLTPLSGGDDGTISGMYHSALC